MSMFIGNESKICEINTGLLFKTEYIISGRERKSTDTKFWSKTTRC